MQIQPGGNVAPRQFRNPDLGAALPAIRDRHASLSLGLGAYDVKPMATLIFHGPFTREEKMARIEEETTHAITQAQNSLRDCCDNILAPYKSTLQTSAIKLFCRGVHQQKEKNVSLLASYKTGLQEKVVSEFETLEKSASDKKQTWFHWPSMV
jgi:hypothetical protein